MAYVRDRQDRMRRLCAATNPAGEFGVLNTSVPLSGIQVPGFLKAPEIAFPGSVFSELAVSDPVVGDPVVSDPVVGHPVVGHKAFTVSALIGRAAGGD